MAVQTRALVLRLRPSGMLARAVWRRHLLCRYSPGAQLGTQLGNAVLDALATEAWIGKRHWRCISRKAERAWNALEARTQGKTQDQTQDQTLRSAEDSAHDQIQNPTLHAFVTRIPAGGTEYGVRITDTDFRYQRRCGLENPHRHGFGGLFVHT